MGHHAEHLNYSVCHIDGWNIAVQEMSKYSLVITDEDSF
jgi:hypothetical protein